MSRRVTCKVCSGEITLQINEYLNDSYYLGFKFNFKKHVKRAYELSCNCGTKEISEFKAEIWLANKENEIL